MLLRRRTLLTSLLAASCAGSRAQATPISLRHAFGDITLPRAPQRIVVVGLHEQDCLYALGLAPVGVHEWFGGRPYATGPWAEAARQAAGAQPAVQKGFAIDLEWVWSLHPDLIVATYAAMDADDYAKLSKIAPVLGPPEGHSAWDTPWQDELRLIALATDRTAQADAVIAQVSAKMAALRAHYPGLIGRTAAAVYVARPQLTGYGPEDATSRFLTDLGLVIPASYAALAGQSGQFTVSLEQIGLFDVDVSLWLADRAGQDFITEQQIYLKTRMAQQHRTVWADTDEMAALSFQTPLSIPWAAERIAPRLARAVIGKTADGAENTPPQ